MELRKNDLLVGAHDLIVQKKLGSGGSGVTYLARVRRPAKGSGLIRGRVVVIKTPHVRSGLTDDEIRGRLKELFEKGLIEAGTKRFLKKLRCVAQVLGHGDYTKLHKDGKASTESMLAIVQEYVPGLRLDRFLLKKYRGRGKVFRGVPRASEFFYWGKKIVSAVRLVHQQQVIHGDIWHNNIIIRAGTEDPILIDFGQAAFAAKGAGFGGRIQGSWMAPEGSGTIGADMYSLGGLLLYLATGDYEEKTTRFPRIEDPEKLKTYIVQQMLRRNRQLYADNWGIADIIARCLRTDPERRTRNTAALLQDISLFARGGPEKHLVASLVKGALGLRKQGTLITALVSGAISSLRDQLADLRWGVLDLHEDIVVGMTQVVSLLSEGDEYLTVTTPGFWHSGNLGVQGRFLSATRQAVLKDGAIIKRLFLITKSDLTRDKELDSIIDAQLGLASDLAARQSSAERHGKYELRFRPVTESERREMLRQGMNFGVLIKGADRLLLSVGYADDGVIGRIQFRTDARLANSFARRFQQEFANETSFPLSSFSAWKEQQLADQRAPKTDRVETSRRIAHKAPLLRRRGER